MQKETLTNSRRSRQDIRSIDRQRGRGQRPLSTEQKLVNCQWSSLRTRRHFSSHAGRRNGHSTRSACQVDQPWTDRQASSRHERWMPAQQDTFRFASRTSDTCSTAASSLAAIHKTWHFLAHISGGLLKFSQSAFLQQWSRTALSTTHTSAKAANIEKLLPLNKHLSQHGGDSQTTTVTLTYVAWSRLPPKSDGFFRGPCVTFPPNFVKISRVVFA